MLMPMVMLVTRWRLIEGRMLIEVIMMIMVISSSSSSLLVAVMILVSVWRTKRMCLMVLTTKMMAVMFGLVG